MFGTSLLDQRVYHVLDFPSFNLVALRAEQVVNFSHHSHETSVYSQRPNYTGKSRLHHGIRPQALSG